MELSASTLVGLVVLGVAAGWLGALIGIGGGVVIVPTLVLGFGVDFRVAVAASLVAVIATSTTAGSVYVGRGLANMRLAMSLEVATTTGGIIGGLTATVLPADVLSGIFSALLVATAALMVRAARNPPERAVDVDAGAGTGWEQRGTLAGGYFDETRGGTVSYRAINLGTGSAISLLAGIVSGVLGLGGGFLKVPAMNLGMRVPVKVAAATSNFMIGVTAAASVFIYFARGYVEPVLIAPLVLGVVGGSALSSRSSGRARPAVLKMILAAVLLVVAALMALRAAGSGIGG